jgi:hypothetical protein
MVAEVPMTHPLPNIIQVRRQGFVPREGKGNAADRTRALGYVHGPAGVSRPITAHHVLDHQLSKSAGGLVMGERHAPDRFVVTVGAIVNGKTVNQHA